MSDADSRPNASIRWLRPSAPDLRRPMRRCRAIATGGCRRAISTPSATTSACCRLLQAEVTDAGRSESVHAACLDDLTTIYPDAQLVMTHCGPEDVVGSFCSRSSRSA